MVKNVISFPNWKNNNHTLKGVVIKVFILENVSYQYGKNIKGNKNEEKY